MLLKSLVAIALALSLLASDSATPVLAQSEGGRAPSREPDLTYETPLADPIEPVNRSIGFINHGFMMGIINPTSWVYRLILPKPVRKCVNNAGENLAYPVRLVNNLLQGQFTGAGVETERFAVNTTVGVAGLFDPASHWEIGSYETDTGKTFGKWGWNSHLYLMLPFLGPSSERDAVGKVGDTLLNPATYLFPASFVFTYNRLSDEVLDYKIFTASEYDPYALSRDLWFYSRLDAEGAAGPAEAEDYSAIQTLDVVRLKNKKYKFPTWRKDKKVFISSTGEKLPYSLWLQRNPAPVVFILPGLAGHRLESSAMVLAESAYNEGFSAVTISSAFNWEFMQSASTSPVPGYAPRDVSDINEALAAVSRDLHERYPGRFTGSALMGVSMGAFHTLLLAASEGKAKGDSGLQFDRYIAINPPVDLMYGMQRLDAFFNAPLAWPPDEREARMKEALRKGVQLARDDHKPRTEPIFSSSEAQFLIGLRYRLSLRDIIHSSQRRNNMGVIRASLGTFNRGEAYDEIAQYSFLRYFESFVVPSIQTRKRGGVDREQVRRAGDLKSFQDGLGSNPKIRVFTNENDFLLSAEDRTWLKETFADGRSDISPKGGHLGNLYQPETQARIMKWVREMLAH
jgi:ABC-type transporter lipoprotein component MlaA/pimeloyl-ACP methyl ester carboxylesterase